MADPIKSQLVEFIRFGKLEKGILREGDLYVVSQDKQPVYPFVMTLDHDDYLDAVKALSYKGKKDKRDAALATIAEVVTAMIRSNEMPLPSAGNPLQLDLVVNAAELGALQFEAALAADGKPLLGRQDCTVTLTRRVRGAFLEQSLPAPERPRVLFAWASPPAAGAEVPHEEHAAILRDALVPWIGPKTDDDPDPEGRVLTVLDDVTLQKLRETLDQARTENNPFSHVHFLAHGYPVKPRSHRQYFGMALVDDNLELEVVEPDQLVEAMSPLRGTSAAVTLATCESGSEANTLIAEKSIAHQLHVSGIPIVVASQYPLTMAGSSILMREFYPAVLEGTDVRIALHRARAALYQNQETAHHDCVSMVAYASLPEGYSDTLLEMKLQRTLASLKTAQKWSDDLVRKGETGKDAFDRIENRLRTAIAGLEKHVARTRESSRRGVLEENLGLLGSAEKRLAELCFHRFGIDAEGGWSEKMHEALNRSWKRYVECAKGNLSHHWTGVQALSLEAVVKGEISAVGLWHAAVQAALIARENEDEYWAHGSLAELYLLAPLAGVPVEPGLAIAMLEEMKARLNKLPAHDGNRAFAPESTARQLRRYVEWWTPANGFKIDLAAEAEKLIAVLK